MLWYLHVQWRWQHRALGRRSLAIFWCISDEKLLCYSGRGIFSTSCVAWFGLSNATWHGEYRKFCEEWQLTALAKNCKTIWQFEGRYKSKSKSKSFFFGWEKIWSDFQFFELMFIFHEMMLLHCVKIVV